MAALIKSLLDSERDAIMSHWKVRAVHATSAHMTPLGGILLGVLGRGRDKLPRFGVRAEIDRDGWVCCDWWDFAGRKYEMGRLAPVLELRDMFRQLADLLNLSDAERLEMFDELRKWIGRDHRTPTVGADGELHEAAELETRS